MDTSKQSRLAGGLSGCVAGVLVGWLGLAGAAAAQNAEPEPADTGPAATSPGAPRPLVATEQSDMALSRLRPEAAVWLDLESAGRALGLFYPEQEPPANGAVVLLADVGDNAASGVADELSRRLTAKGWAVLALGLPAPTPSLQRYLETPPSPAGSTSDDKDDDASAGDQSSVMIDVMAASSGNAPDQGYRNRVRESLAAATAALAERGYDQPALVGLGKASNHLVALDENLQGARALIWVAPEFYERDAGALAQQVAEGSTAILELYTSRGAARDDSQRRWADLRRAGVERLERQPVAISRPLAAHGAGAIAGRIDAWLKAL
ncbi:MAG: DUF3530 family protein [Pseudomonadota bacterium]|nr:DUF3530 family protein [Pseudomonadota bacterium]